jgi:hypothetical protein
MRLFALWAALVLVTSPTVATRAGDGCSDSNCGARACCPRCHETCELTVSKEEAKESCWDVECKTICIPRITFPWQKCGQCGSCCGGKCDLDKSSGKCQDLDCDAELAKCGSDACGAARCARAKTVRSLKKVELTCARCKYKWTPTSEKACGECKAKADVESLEAEPEVPPPPPVAARGILGKPVFERVSVRNE